MEQITMRQVTIADIEALQAIGKQAFYETFAESNTPENMEKYLTDSFSLERLTVELKGVGSEFFFAMLAETPIGYLKLNHGQAQTELRDSTALEIERIYVLKGYQGKQVGQRLYEKALERARTLKADFVWLGVWEKNVKAIKFYEKNGFVAFDQHVFMLGEDEQTDIMMKLVL